MAPGAGSGSSACSKTPATVSPPSTSPARPAASSIPTTSTPSTITTRRSLTSWPAYRPATSGQPFNLMHSSLLCQGVPDLSEHGDVYDLTFGLGADHPPTAVALRKEFQRIILYQQSPQEREDIWRPQIVPRYWSLNRDMLASMERNQFVPTNWPADQINKTIDPAFGRKPRGLRAAQELSIKLDKVEGRDNSRLQPNQSKGHISTVLG
uniref:Uncharacterized protein n=1 Tax=Oryza meridionalis TaxID=40149 RepID=A0A0E0F1X7_9ORYZ